MESLRQDVRLAIRLLLKQPGFSLLVITTLALGIGLSTALFSILDAAFIRPLPYPNPEQLVILTVEEPSHSGEAHRMDPSRQDVDDWFTSGASVFTHVAFSRTAFFEPLVVEAAEPVKTRAELVSRDYFAMYGMRPALGRAFADDDFSGNGRAVILGHGFWQTHFGGQPDILGRTIRVNGEASTVVGVLPAWFYREATLWRPLIEVPRQYARRGRGVDVHGRLRPGITIAQAEAALTAIAESAASSRGGKPVRVRLESMYESVTADNVAAIKTIAWSVGVLLLLACINVAGLLLARGSQRAPELAVRASLGASRPALLKQLLTESLVLSSVAAVLGVTIAWISLGSLTAYLPLSLPANAPLSINARVLALVLGATVSTTLLFGLLPAVRLSRTNIASLASRSTGRTGGALTRRGGQLLIFAEVALAVVLLCGTGLMIRSFARVLKVDIGFRPDVFTTIDVSPAATDPAARRLFYPALLDALAANPAIESVAAADQVPLLGTSTRMFATVEGKRYSIDIRRYLGAYFDALGFRLKAGALPSLVRPGGGRAPVVINETAVERLFGSTNPIGRAITVGTTTGEVVAVVDDIRHWGPMATRDLYPEVYLPAFSRGGPDPLIVVARARQGHSITREAVRDAAAATGQRAVVQEIHSGRHWYSEHLVPALSPAVLFGVLGGTGFVLALVGVFGMTAYAVSRRVRDIGVRMALGASPSAVSRAFLTDSTLPAIAGVVAGLVASWWATRVVRDFLFQTEPRDMATFAVVAFVLVATTSLAAWIPARRAARVDPIVALRAE